MGPKTMDLGGKISLVEKVMGLMLSQYWIIRGKFPASRGSIFIITFVALALIITSLVVVMTVDPTVFEK